MQLTMIVDGSRKSGCASIRYEVGLGGDAEITLLWRESAAPSRSAQHRALDVFH